MEFAVSSELPIYSGGLGVLAGDHLKAAADLGLPLVGVGLLYRGGYFAQGLSDAGRQTEDYQAVDPEAAGLVRRSELADKRRVGFELTDEGERVLLSVKRRRTAWLAERLRDLSPSELDAVDAAVEPLLKLLDVDA